MHSPWLVCIQTELTHSATPRDVIKSAYNCEHNCSATTTANIKTRLCLTSNHFLSFSRSSSCFTLITIVIWWMECVPALCNIIHTYVCIRGCHQDMKHIWDVAVLSLVITARFLFHKLANQCDVITVDLVVLAVSSH